MRDFSAHVHRGLALRTSGRVVAAILSCAAWAGAGAQDSRDVQEPSFPPLCIVLTAELTGPIQPADEEKLDTARLQQAIDHCGEGNAVKLVAADGHNAFLSGPLELKNGVTLLVDKGVTLYASRDPKLYETRPNGCGLVDDQRDGCKALISASHAANIGIMGDGVIDGRGGERLLIDGKEWIESWWDLAEDARKGGNQEVPRLIVTESCDNLTLYRITLRNSPNFHVVPHRSNGVTLWGVKIDTPGSGARNTDGIDPSASTNITVTESFIRAGDDNIAVKAGDGPVTNVTVSHDHFYWGHGMSIGSETVGGVSHVLVTDLTLDGTTSGVRIKSNFSRGGLVHDVTFENVCVRNSKTPVDLDTAYTNPGPYANRLPVFEDITLRNVRIAGGGILKLNGFDATHRIGVRFDGVMLDTPAAFQTVANHADITLGPGPVNFNISGRDTTVKGAPGKGRPAPCSAAFVPFPVTQ